MSIGSWGDNVAKYEKDLGANERARLEVTMTATHTEEFTFDRFSERHTELRIHVFSYRFCPTFT